MFRGAGAADTGYVDRRKRAEVPVYQDASWWEGEEVRLDERTVAEVEALTNPCFHASEECDVPELREDALFQSLNELPPLDEAIAPFDELQVPCLTTDEGCAWDEAQAAAIVDDASVAASPSATVAQHPCFWDEGCLSFS
jgi:hypothetical protein